MENTTFDDHWKSTGETSIVQDDFLDHNFHVSPTIHHLVFKACSAVLILIGVFGLFANFSIFILFFSSPTIRTPFNYLLMNMILAETLIVLFGIPVDTVASLQYGWKMGRTFCILTGFVLTTLGTISIATLAFLSLQRFLTVKNCEIAKISSYSQAFWIIASIWIYTFCISVPPFFGFGAFVIEESGLTCTPDWTSREQIAYITYWFISGFFVPLMVILVTSALTINHLRMQKNKSVSEAVKKLSEKREKRIGALILWMNISFLMCWMPYGVICCCYIIGGKGFVPPEVVILPLMAAKTSVCWNPILYIIMNPQFRNAYRHLNGDPTSQRQGTSPSKRRMSTDPVAQSRNKIRTSVRRLLQRPCFNPVVFANLESLNKHRRLSLEESALVMSFAESSVRRALTIENVKTLDQMTGCITQDLYDYARKRTSANKKTTLSRVEFRDLDSISSNSSVSHLLDGVEGEEQPKILVPARPLSGVSNSSNWICFDEETLYVKIFRQDQEFFGIDWKPLDKLNGFGLPNLASSASHPDVYLRDIDIKLF